VTIKLNSYCKSAFLTKAGIWWADTLGRWRNIWW